MQPSLWQDTCNLPNFEKLKENKNVDVLIIGGGMAGILCAYYLHQKNINYILCEAKTIGSGTTARTTAVLSAQHDILYSDLIKKGDLDYAKLYLEANLNAINEFKRLANDIPCDFEICPSYQYTAKNPQQLKNEKYALKQIDFDAKLTHKNPLPVESEIMLGFPYQAQFHPLKFIAGIAQNLNIYEQTKIDKIEETTAFFGSNKITAKKIIVCTHFPIMNTHGLYYAKLYQKKSYVLALTNAPKFNGTFVDNDNGFYFRNHKEFLIVGGGDHRTGKIKDGFKTVRDFVNSHFPKAVEKYAWTTQDCMSLDNVAYIGNYSKNTPNIYTATGFNEWGMTTSMLSSQILCDMVCGKKNKYEDVFNPSRNIIHPQLFANMGETILNFATPIPKRCTHLGCALKWNKYEHTWDCSCHGSRFSEKGEIINNPATKELE